MSLAPQAGLTKVDGVLAVDPEGNRDVVSAPHNSAANCSR